MNIIVIQLAKMGDIFQSQFLLNKIKQKYPNSTVSFLCSSLFFNAAKLVNADKIISINLDNYFESKPNNSFTLKNKSALAGFVNCLGNFNIAINLNTNMVAKHVLNLVNANTKLGYGSGNAKTKLWLNFCASFVKNRKLSMVNLCDIWLNLIGFDSYIHLNKNSNNINSNLILLNPETRNVKRTWPLKNWVNLAILLHKKGFKIGIIGTQKKTSQYFKNNCNVSYTNFVGKTSVYDLYKLLQNCHKIVSCDTGTIHLAALANCPTTAIFIGPAYAFETFLYNKNSNVVFLNNLNCYPCYENNTCENNFKCQNLISEQMVLNAILNKNEFVFYSPVYDALGQYLVPNIKINISDYELMKLIHRTFLVKYFTLKELDIKPILQKYKYDNEIILNFHNLYNREIKISSKLLSNFKKTDKVPNLKLTSPLFWLVKLGNNSLAYTLQNYLQNINLNDFFV